VSLTGVFRLKQGGKEGRKFGRQKKGKRLDERGKGYAALIMGVGNKERTDNVNGNAIDLI